MTIKHLMWVKEPQVSEYLRLGWTQAAQRPTRHHIYSTLMEWPFTSDPVHPKPKETAA